MFCSFKANRAYPHIIHSFWRFISVKQPYYWYSLIPLRPGDNRDPAGNSWKGRAEIKSPLAIPAQLLHTIGQLAPRQDISENWTELESGEIFGGRECCLWVSRCAQAMNVSLTFLQDDFCVCDSLFPWPSAALSPLSSIWITRHALE